LKNQSTVVYFFKFFDLSRSLSYIIKNRTNQKPTMGTMNGSSRFTVYTTLLVLSLKSAQGAENDLFNFGYTTYSDGRINYGQPNWGSITCPDPLACVSIAIKCVQL
jgi:hypothetical protein